MQATAVLDIAIGVCLALNIFVPLAALLGALHLVSVLIVTGITGITVRDLGLLGAASALFLETSQSILKRRAWMDFLSPKKR